MSANDSPASPTPTTLPIAGEIHVKSILVPTDFSPSSLKAVLYAERLAKDFNSTIVLLHVFLLSEYAGNLPDPTFGLSPTEVQAAYNASRQRDTDQLTNLRDELRARGRQVDIQLVNGTAYEQIVCVARNMEVDLIVLSTHGRSGWQRLVMGSTAERVVRLAPCPVLTVRDKERDFVEPAPGA